MNNDRATATATEKAQEANGVPPVVYTTGYATIQNPQPNDVLTPDGNGNVAVTVHLIQGGQFAVKVDLAAMPPKTPPVGAQVVFASNGSTVVVNVPAPGAPGAGMLNCAVRVWGWSGIKYLVPTSIPVFVDRT